MNLKFIISPTKNLKLNNSKENTNVDYFDKDKTDQLLNELKSYSIEDLKEVFGISNKIANNTFDFFHNFEVNPTYKALFAYDGIQFKSMNPIILDKDSLEYLNKHLYILDAFYGIVRPYYSIKAYRLMLEVKLKNPKISNLYDFWNDSLYQELYKDRDTIVINLASVEYSKIISKYIKPDDKFVNFHFVERKNDKLVAKSTYAKMARGAFVKYCALNKIESFADLLKFDKNYKLDKDLGDENNYYFVANDQ